MNRSREPYEQPTWLQSGVSLRDYLSARRAAIEGQPEAQIARKTATRPQPRRISRMTPAPPDKPFTQGIVLPSWGGDESEVEVLSSPHLKRTRELEPAPPRFIDLRTGKDVYGKSQVPSRAGRRHVGRKEVKEVAELEDLAQRVGNNPQKKLAGISQVAYKAIPRMPRKQMTEAMRPERQHQSQRKPAMPRNADVPKSAARKAILAPIPMSSDDESALSITSDEEEIDELDPTSSEAEVVPRSVQEGTMGHRPTPSVAADPDAIGAPHALHSPTPVRPELRKYRSQTVDDSSSDEDEVTTMGHTLPPLQAIEPEFVEPEERISTPTVEPEPIIQLFRAFQLHTLPTDILQEGKQLPFLVRNLRLSFKVLCHNLGIPNTPLAQDKDGTILVRYEHVANASFERPVPKWFCPLCNLLGRLETREMLVVHLRTCHQEMYVDWVQPTENEGVSRLHILIPEIDSDAVRSPPQETMDPSLLFPPNEPRSPPSPATPASAIASKGQKPYAPFIPRPSRYPRPPPSSNWLGAAARPPYLPAKSTFGGPDIHYSTRFGGPCLFDLLQLLPLEPFGVFDGHVIEREEEIYNDDELPEEEKVITALWARWIMLHKRDFDRDRAQGVKMFIDEYWRMIHLAAGWQALVHQLLVLAAWRLLKHHDIIPLLEHYEDLVGMGNWDDWDSNEE